MSGTRLVVGIIVMGIAIPAMLFFLLGLQTFSQFFTISAATFLAWGLADLLANILERPRLANRSAGDALRDDWERRTKE